MEIALDSFIYGEDSFRRGDLLMRYFPTSKEERLLEEGIARISKKYDLKIDPSTLKNSLQKRIRMLGVANTMSKEGGIHEIDVGVGLGENLPEVSRELKYLCFETLKRIFAFRGLGRKVNLVNDFLRTEYHPKPEAQNPTEQNSQ